MTLLFISIFLANILKVNGSKLPRLAWSSLQLFTCNDLTVDIIGEICGALTTSGLLKAGYNSILLPTCIEQYSDQISQAAKHFEIFYFDASEMQAPSNFDAWSQDYVNDNPANGSMTITNAQTPEQMQAQFSMNAIYHKPIFIGIDVRILDDTQMYTNQLLLNIQSDDPIAFPGSATIQCTYRVARRTKIGTVIAFLNAHDTPCDILRPFDSFHQSESIDSIKDVWSGLDVSATIPILTMPPQSGRMFLVHLHKAQDETPTASVRALINIMIFSVILASCFVITVVWRRNIRRWAFQDDGEEPTPREGDEIQCNIQTEHSLSIDLMRHERRKLNELKIYEQL